jgi:DNA-binding SARP family transcriptional activator
MRARARLAAITAALSLALLWAARPPLDELPSPLGSQAAAQVAPLVYAVAWSALALLLLVGLLRAIRASIHVHARGKSSTLPRWLTANWRRRAPAPGPIALWPSPAGPTPQLLIREHVDSITAPAPPMSDDSSAGATQHRRRRPDLATGPRAHSGSDESAMPFVSVLGPLTISGGKRTRRGLRAAALELLAYLALRPHGASRDEVLEALWPGDDPRRSRERLYQATRDARRLLGAALANEHDRYLLDRNQVRVDVDELEQLVRCAERSSDEAAGTELLERALALFQGEPLAGSDYRWADGDLRRLRVSYVDLLERVSRTRLVRHDARGTLELAERALALDQLNETFWRLALEAESVLGLREAVTARYEQLARLLDERLGLAPAQETKALYRRLLGQS